MNVLAAGEVIRTGNGDRNGACKTVTMMEDPQTPGSDCNSNPANDPQDLVGSEFIQDNMDYQWFIDYRDGGLHVHPSVLSSLSVSYTKDDLGYYDDLARNLDANLAEVDMESFRTADIHTLLTALPVMCTDPVQHSEFNYQRERFASISGSVMEKLDICSSISPRASSQGEDSACSTTDTISICKSSLLFSPVKEMPVLPPGGSYSVDSLDCEDMLITCQTNNKNNYTIAFEGSIAMYSDGSQDFDNQVQSTEKQKVYNVPESYYDKALNFKNMIDLSMACSDSKIYTTWSNLKHSSISKTITRHPSGNNNTTPNFLQSNNISSGQQILSNKTRCQSLPDLRKARRENERVEMPLNFSVDSGETSSRSGRLQSSGSIMSRSMNEESSDSVGNTLSSNKKLQNMSLVRLFMKQKSMSTEGMSLTLDQTDSGSETGWPISSNSESGTNTTQIQRLQRQPQNQQNLTVPENDLAIKWVKTTDIYSDGPKKSINCSTSMEDLLNTSRSGSSITRDASSRCARWKETNSKTTTGTQVMTEVEDNGVQTSMAYPSPNSSKDSTDPGFRETLVNEKPVYVIYPNYTLPDLSFLNSTESRFDKVALKPQVYGKRSSKAGRPFSCNDIDVLKQKGFAHVKDWESLTFLLPNEYRKILYDVPEVSKHVRQIGEEACKPLFCLSPPMRHRKRTFSDMIPNTIVSSSSSTATQPSSGYRGSSTMLTDSSSNQQNSALGNNPLYLYRYDSVSSEASMVGQEKLVTGRQHIGQQQHQRTSPNAPCLPKRSISLPQGTDGTPAPPRPPLPRSILRKNRAAAVAAGKRCSMFEMDRLNEIEARYGFTQENKRMSLQEPYYMNNDMQLLRHNGIIDSEKDIDEIEEGQRFDRLKGLANEDLESSSEDVKQLEEYLKRSGFSSHSSDGDTGSEHDSDIKLRSCVRRFLALKMNQDMAKMIDLADSQKKTVSFAVNGKQRYHEEKANAMDEKERLNVSESTDINVEMRPLDLEDKKKMIWSVNKAVDSLLKFWHSEPVHSRQGYNDKSECSQLCLTQLCPALYAVMSDGLKPQLNSTFGPIANSVWQVVEASSQQGPLTKTLNDLVQKINGEDLITEGMLKFHAFVFGLLNLRALDAWFAYLCTRESILRKHYNNNSLFVGALGCATNREVVDAFLNILEPLAFCPFQLDLLYQYRQLHNSFGQGNVIIGDAKKQVTPRPRSCVLYDTRQYDDEKRSEEDVKKRWSHTPLSAKFHVFDRLDDSEDYTDSLEHSPLNKASPRKAIPTKPQSKLLDAKDLKSRKDGDTNTGTTLAGENKFRKLQEKWEQLGERDNTNSKDIQNPSATTTTPSPSSPTRTPGKSKIPRLLTSPIRTPSNLPIPIKPTKSLSCIPSLKKPSVAAKPGTVQSNKKVPESRNCKDSPRRTSRLDQENIGTPRTHLTRPSSLPYKTYGTNAKEKNTVSPHRRAASTSLPRPHSIAAPPRNVPSKQTPKIVRTMSSKPQSEDGHLSFGEGEKLKVILEVDSKWLLCARGERKGLVPRNCVRPVQT